MDNRRYISKMGEEKNYSEWKKWAIDFYKGLGEVGYTELPNNWFERISRVLKLEAM